jgi:hypothetical protein
MPPLSQSPDFWIGYVAGLVTAVLGLLVDALLRWWKRP